MPKLAHGIEPMPRSGIREIMDVAWHLRDPIIGLHVGEPNFSAPDHVLAAAQNSYARGDTHYVPNSGTPELRNAVHGKVTSYNRLSVSTEQVVITAGGMQALYLAFSLILNPGDEALIPDPGWPNFAMATQLLKSTPVQYTLHPKNNFLPDISELERLVTANTRVIVLNSPSNPLGTILPTKTITDLLDFANRYDLWVISDECYDGLVFGNEHVSPGRYDTRKNVLSCFSFSKTYAMTGLRVGYLVVPESIADDAAKLQEALLSCVNAPAQAAAVAALRGPQGDVLNMCSSYCERRDAATAQLEVYGIPYVEPEGAFYLWIDVRDRCNDDVRSWSLALLRDRRVAVAPGTAFGRNGEGWIRVSLATQSGDLLEGIRLIAQAG